MMVPGNSAHTSEGGGCTLCAPVSTQLHEKYLPWCVPSAASTYYTREGQLETQH